MKLQRLCWGALTAVLLSGCGGGDAGGGAERKPTHKVSGTVTLAGGPVADASVTFSPKEGQPVAFGRTDSAGKYTLTTYEAGDGAVAGKYVALVTKVTAGQTGGPVSHDAFVSGGANPGAHGAAAGGKSSSVALPESYASASTSNLFVEVKDGENDIPLDLKP